MAFFYSVLAGWKKACFVGHAPWRGARGTPNYLAACELKVPNGDIMDAKVLAFLRK